MNNMKIPKELYEDMMQTGSSVICDPPVTDTDIDFVIYTKNLDRLSTWLINEGFKKTSKDEYEIEDLQNQFCCFRLHVVNLIVVSDKEIFNKWVEATTLAKRLNLRIKQQRIELFKYIFER